jgi:hypothetical protein
MYKLTSIEGYNMQNTNYVFLAAADAAIVVTVNNTVVATDVQTADALVEVFLQNNINVLQDTIMCSSSIDFAEEEGFASDASAHNIIDEAFEALS